MNLFLNHFSIEWQQAWELLGWTMCYFLAIGTVVALTGAVMRLACRQASPQIRYTVSLSVFMTLAALPLGIAYWLMPTMVSESTPTSPLANIEAVSPEPVIIELKDRPIAQMPPLENAPIDQPQLGIAEFPAVTEVAHPQENAALERTVKFLPWLWIVGAPLTFVLLTTGLIGSQRLRKQSTLVVEGALHEAVSRLRKSMRVTRNVSVAICERVASPLLVGVVRPLILLPPAALSGWTTEELEMVLLHELAHVRRWDNLVNFLQRIVESVLFFHPGVWWVSRWVRVDREECCDAVVVSHTAKPQAYAELLVSLATPSSPIAGLAMAQHPLAGRIRRILKLEDEKMLVSRSALGWLGLVGAALLIAATWQPSAEIVAEESAVVDTVEEPTAEVAESAEWREIGHDKFEFSPGVPFSEVEKRIRKLESEGKKVFVEKRFDGSVRLRGRALDVPATPVQPAPPVFLSLEDQRAADLAYKLLNVELEQLGSEDLKRVQAKKFAGGLLVTSVKQRNIKSAGPLRQGDLLVGLHVWPTTSLADIREVLKRDDLPELSPLKFYVIRKTRHQDANDGGDFGGEYGGYGGGFGGEFGGRVKLVDKLVTGRVEVNVIIKPLNAPPALSTAVSSPQPYAAQPLYAPQASAPSGVSGPPVRTVRPTKAKPTPYNLVAGDQVKIVVAGAFPDQPIADVYTIEDEGTVALGPTYGRVKITGLTVLEAEKKILQQLEKSLKKPAVQVTLFKKNETQTGNSLTPYVSQSALPTLNKKTSKDLATLKSKIVAAQIELEAAATKYRVAKNSYEAKLERNKQNNTEREDLATEKLRAEAEHARLMTERAKAVLLDLARQQDATQKPTLLYDNKTFEQWRSLWKNELKTEKRTEAIKAMAAFARAGYGKEAAEAILDVAGEYDFSTWGGDDPAGKLKEEVVNIFAEHGKRRISPEFWLSSLLGRLDEDPNRWGGLAVAILWSGYSEQPEIQSQLLAAAQNEKYSPKTRGCAIQALVYSDQELKNPEVVKLIHNAFASDEPELVNAAIKSLYFRKLDEFPEQLELFFHPEESVRYETCMRLENNESWSQISDHLLAVLNDPKRAEDHENAIVAFGWGNLFSQPGSFKQKQVVIDRLYDVLINGDKDLLPSALRALKNLTAQSDTLVIQEIENEITPERREELAAAVKEKILESMQGHGGGFGGGGGFF